MKDTPAIRMKAGANIAYGNRKMRRWRRRSSLARPDSSAKSLVTTAQAPLGLTVEYAHIVDVVGKADALTSFDCGPVARSDANRRLPDLTIQQDFPAQRLGQFN